MEMLSKQTLRNSFLDVMHYFASESEDGSASVPFSTVTHSCPTEVEDNVLKALVESFRFNKYYAIREKSLVNLGFEIPIDAVNALHESVNQYVLLIFRKVGSKNNPEVMMLDKDMTTSEAQDQAIAFVENNKNAIEAVRVGIGVPWTFADRPIFKSFIMFHYVMAGEQENVIEAESKGSDVLDEKNDLNTEVDRIEGFIDDDYIVEFFEKQSTSTQSILFPKGKFSVDSARSWLTSHKKHSGKVDSPAAFHRFRQFDPGQCGSTPKTISLGSGGVKAVICVKKAEPASSDVHVDSLASDKKKKKKKKKKKTKTEEDVYHEVIFRVEKSDLLAKGLVTGIVYAPDTEDSHGDFTSKAEIERAAHEFLPRAILNRGHTDDLLEGVEVVENYIAPIDFVMNNGEMVKEGSWVITSKVTNEELRGQILRGEITGYSLEGTAYKV